MRIPRWVWYIVCVVGLLVLLVVLNVNINLGSRGISVTQELVH